MAPSTVEERVAVDGGSLTDKRGGNKWYPREIVVVGGNKFVTLSGREYQMCQFMGLTQDTDPRQRASEGFLNFLKLKRNEAVDAAVLVDIRLKDQLSQITSLPKGVRRKYANAYGDDGQSLPNFVDVPFPPMSHGGESTNAGMVRMTMELSPSRCVSVALSPEALDIIRMAALTFSVDDDGHKKRKHRSERVRTGSKYAHVDYRRKSFWCGITTFENVSKRIYRKPTRFDDPDSRSDAIADLLQVVREQHYARDAARNLVLASVHKLEMFRSDIDDEDDDDDDELEMHDRDNSGDDGE